LDEYYRVVFSYEEVRSMVECRFYGDAALVNERFSEPFSEFHALIVHTGEHFCRTRQPLGGDGPHGPHLAEGR
jgi:endonuclease III-like uncharacterized protein